MYWDDPSKKFIDDNSCAFQTLWETIPCNDCDQFNQINTSVSVCRCSHLSRFGVVYGKSNSLIKEYGNSPGIYSDFYAMKYWTESFGFLASLAGLITFIIGHVFIQFIDGRLQHNLIVKMREKVRRFELKYGATLQRQDGLFLKNEGAGRSGKVASKKKVYMQQPN